MRERRGIVQRGAMNLPDLPAPARAEFEKYRAAEDQKLFRQRFVHADEVWKHLDGLLEQFADRLFRAAANERWPVEVVRHKLEVAWDAIVEEFVRQHRR